MLRLFDRVIGTVGAVAIAATAVLTCAAVFFRYVMNSALSWPEEIAGYLLVWITYCGAYMASRKNEHISFDLLVLFLPPVVGKTIQVLVDFFLVAFFAYLCALSFAMVRNLVSTSLQSVEITEEIFMIAIPIFAGGVCLHMANDLFMRWRGR